MIVMKFGGTSVGSGERMRAVARIVAGQRGRGPVVVTSAMSGVTDALLRLAGEAARGGDPGEIRRLVDEIVARHVEAIPGEEPERRLRELGGSLASLLQGIGLVGETSRRVEDALLSFGERMAVIVLAAAMLEAGLQVEPVFAPEVIRVRDAGPTGWIPIWEQTVPLCVERLGGAVAEGKVPLVTGFLAEGEGRTVTLGRGGSDYTATILGRALDAEEVEIWTDVDGVMSADPRVVPQARVLPAISYLEAAELSYFGGKVLHSKTLTPLREKGTPVRIRNSLRPEASGTWVRPSAAATRGLPKTVTSIGEMALIEVSGPGMAGVVGLAARVFAAVASARINVLMISQGSSEQSICFVIPRADGASAVEGLRREFAAELGTGRIEAIRCDPEVAIVAVVGEGMRGTPGISGRVFTALGAGGINVIVIAQGSSEVNISFLVRDADGPRAVQTLHDALGLAEAHEA